MKFSAFTILALLFCGTLFASTEDVKEFDWRGFSLRLDLGSALSLTGPVQSLKPFNMNLEPFLELGGEYAFVFAEHFYLSGGLSWLITYPRNFKPARGFFEPPVALWWAPLTYVQGGYIFSNGVLLSLGVVYLWAVDLLAKFPLNENWFFEAKGILWLDRIFESASHPLYGFDNLHASLGIGYKF